MSHDERQLDRYVDRVSALPLHIYCWTLVVRHVTFTLHLGADRHSVVRTGCHRNSVHLLRATFRLNSAEFVRGLRRSVIWYIASSPGVMTAPCATRPGCSCRISAASRRHSNHTLPLLNSEHTAVYYVYL